MNDMATSSIIGSGSAIGSVVLSNADHGEEIGIGREWFEAHTGIRSRRACAADESASGLAVLAVNRCLADAGLTVQDIGSETMLLHIHNGLEDFTPPPAIQLAESLGLERVRVLSIDGVCAEPIPAIEIADMMIRAGRCERAIVSASADFLAAIDKQD